MGRVICSWCFQFYILDWSLSHLLTCTQRSCLYINRSSGRKIIRNVVYTNVQADLISPIPLWPPCSGSSGRWLQTSEGRRQGTSKYFMGGRHHLGILVVSTWFMCFFRFPYRQIIFQFKKPWSGGICWTDVWDGTGDPFSAFRRKDEILAREPRRIVWVRIWTVFLSPEVQCWELSTRYKVAGATYTDLDGSTDVAEFINVSKDDAMAYPNVAHKVYPSTINIHMKDVIRPFIESCLEETRVLLEIFNQKLGLPEGTLAELHRPTKECISESRCIKVPAAPKNTKIALGQHTDFGR